MSWPWRMVEWFPHEQLAKPLRDQASGSKKGRQQVAIANADNNQRYSGARYEEGSDKMKKEILKDD